MSHRTPFFTAVVAALILVAGCGRGIDESATGVTAVPPSSTTTSTQPVTTDPVPEQRQLVVWAPVRQSDAIRIAGEAFTTATGIEVTIETVELDDVEVALAGTVGPDIFVGRHVLLASLAERGLAAPIDLEARRADFSGVAIDAFTYGGATYGAPFGMRSAAMFHNSAVVPTAPGAFSEIKELCAQLRGTDEPPEDTTTTTTETTEPVAPAFGCAELEASDGTTMVDLLTAGDSYLFHASDGPPDLTDTAIAGPGATSRAETLRGLVADGVVAIADDRAAMVGRFTTGETPILFAGADLAEELRRSGVGFGVAPLPILTGAQPAPLVDVVGFMVSGRSNQQETASLFITDYLITAETVAGLLDAMPDVPALGAAADAAASDPVTSGMLRAAERGRPLPPVLGIDALLADLGPLLAGVFQPSGEEITAVLSQAEARVLGSA